jgi:hypothetical protein
MKTAIDNYTTESLKEIQLKKQIAELEIEEAKAELFSRIAIVAVIIVYVISLML